MKTPTENQVHGDHAEENRPLHWRATTRERNLLEISKRHLDSIKKEIESGTPVAPGMVNELEHGIAELESAYGAERNDRRK